MVRAEGPHAPSLFYAFETRAQALIASPRQPGWPHEQTTSVFPAVASQWALQYLEPSVVVQLQAGLSHFFGLVICSRSSSIGDYPPHYETDARTSR